MKHFLSEPGSFSFFCTQFPASFLPVLRAIRPLVLAQWTITLQQGLGFCTIIIWSEGLQGYVCSLLSVWNYQLRANYS